MTGGEGFVPERIATLPDRISSAANDAADANPKYEQLQRLVENLVLSLRLGDAPSAVLDLRAVEGECDQLGFGTEPPQ
jgi:hypothetical protein